MEAEFSRLASLLEQDGAKRESIGKEVRSEHTHTHAHDRKQAPPMEPNKVRSHSSARCVCAPSFRELNRIFRNIQFTLQKVHSVCNEPAGQHRPLPNSLPRRRRACSD